MDSAFVEDMEPICSFCDKSVWNVKSECEGEFEFEAIEYNTVETDGAEITICVRCYEKKSFGNLTSLELATLHYDFGHAYEEGVDYQISSRRLRDAMAAYPCPELQGALGYALWKAGYHAEAIRHCRESVMTQPNHFGASKALHVILKSDPNREEFLLQLKTLGIRVKTIPEEFCGWDERE